MAEPGPAPVFAALGDPTRLGLLAKLADGAPRSISALAAEAPQSRQALTKHLRVMEGAGLVESRRVGRETRFALRPAPLHEARDWLEAAARQWDEALARLRAHLGE